MTKNLLLVAAAAVFSLPANAQDVYAVGGFQGWDPANPTVLSYDPETGCASGTISGVSSLKLSTAYGSWDEFDAKAIVPVDALVAGTWTNYINGTSHVNLPAWGDWTFTIDIVNSKMKVEEKAQEGDVEKAVIYLPGSMNGWTFTDAWKFSTDDGDKYTISVAEMSASDNWKVATSDWGRVNLGGGQVTLNTPFVMVNSGSNCFLTEDVTDVTFVFTLSNNTLVVTGTTGISDVVVGNSNADYYTLQGIRVANPTPGAVYIVKNGNKVSKRIIR